MKNDFKPLQRLQDGSWLVTFTLNHRDADTGELKPRMHQVAFTRKPTIEMVKRRLRTFVLAYYDEVDFNINKFDFEPYN